MQTQRDLNREAAIWYFFTSPEFYELAAQECEKMLEFFGGAAIARGATRVGRNNQIYDAFKEAARDFRRGAEFARLDEYKIARGAAVGMRGDIRGMLDQPLSSWMTETEYKEFNNRTGHIHAYIQMVECSLNHALIKSESFFNPELDEDIRNRDDGFPDEDIERWYANYTNREYYDLPWVLPDPLPEYEIDKTRPCKTGEEVPWTGVWWPEGGLYRRSLTFAIKGLRMQPVYTVLKTKVELEMETGRKAWRPETKAAATTWYPVIPTGRTVQADNEELRIKAGEPCPRSGLWRSLDGKEEQRLYKEGEPMANLGSPYGLTVWQFVGNH